MKYTDKQLNTALNKAKIGIMSENNSVFITTVLFKLKHIWTNKTPTARVTHKNLYVNPDFFMKLKPEERIGLLAHEPWHIALMHLTRGEGKNHKKYNMAADYVINNMLLAADYELPPNGLWDKKYDGMSTEQVYDLLPDPSENDRYDMDFSNEDGESIEEIEAEITDILIEARMQSKSKGDDPGTIPSDIEVELDKLLYPKLPWFTILSNYLTALFGKGESTYKKPNRRYFPEYILPTAAPKQSLCHVACFVDTSCSVSDRECLVYVSELNGIKQQLNPEKMTIIDFDTSLKKVRTLREFDQIKDIRFKGRGGTDISPVMKWIEKNKPELAIIFTDGGFNPYEPKGLKTNIIWIINCNPDWTSNLGKVVHFDL